MWCENILKTRDGMAAPDTPAQNPPQIPPRPKTMLWDYKNKLKRCFPGAKSSVNDKYDFGPNDNIECLSRKMPRNNWRKSWQKKRLSKTWHWHWYRQFKSGKFCTMSLYEKSCATNFTMFDLHLEGIWTVLGPGLSRHLQIPKNVVNWLLGNVKILQIKNTHWVGSIFADWKALLKNTM